MNDFTTAELESAQKAILSTIRKSEKALETLSAKQPPRTAQVGLVSQRLKALTAAASLVGRELHNGGAVDRSKEDFAEAFQVVLSLIGAVEKVKPKLKEGTPQHTLAVRRIEALRIAAALLKREAD